MKRVLVAYDGSSAARQALAHAAEVAGADGSVSVVNVMPEPGISARIEPPSDERYRQRLLLDEALKFLANGGIRAKRVAAVGDAATEIIAAAEKLAADVIVVGRRRGHRARLHGSVSSRLARTAACDVLVVHESGGAEAANERRN
jgi:nucleotide-binding universal stress UspA family protein